MQPETPDRDSERPLADDIDPQDATPADGPGHPGEPGAEPDDDHVVEEKGEGERSSEDG